MKIKKLLFLAFIFCGIVFTGCAKRQVQNAPNGDKIEIDKKDLLQFIGDDLKAEEKVAEKIRYQGDVLAQGDRISITIYEKLPVSQEKRIELKRIGEDSTIFLLPVGDIRLGGFTLTEAERIIEDLFSKIVVSPHCEVQLLQKQYEPRVYVFGEVTKSGTVPFKQGNRLLDALSLAQGCSESAYRRSIKVIRTENEKVVIYSINLHDILNAGNVYKNIVLKDQDIVFIPRRFITGFKEVFSVLALVVPWYVLVQGLMLK